MDSGATIGIVAASLAVGIGAGMAIAYRNSPVAYQAGPRLYGVFDYFSIINWFKVLYYFLPYGLFLFGVIYDGLIEKIKFFPAGFVGLLAVYINSWFSSGGNTVDQDICGIPGLSQWGSDLSPQNMVFVSAVLSYIATYITVKRDTIEIMSVGASWIALTAIWVLQTFFYNTTGCSTTKAWRTPGPVQIVPPLLALVWGGGVGALFGWVFATFVNVGGGVSPEQQNALVGAGKSAPAMAPTSGTAGAGKCSSTGGDDDQFVCEAYKNGELVTSTIAE